MSEFKITIKNYDLDARPPNVEGYKCYWVNRNAWTRVVEFIYRKVAA